jgi:hypothetical protein
MASTHPDVIVTCGYAGVRSPDRKFWNLVSCSIEMSYLSVHERVVETTRDLGLMIKTAFFLNTLIKRSATSSTLPNTKLSMQ